MFAPQYWTRSVIYRLVVMVMIFISLRSWGEEKAPPDGVATPKAPPTAAPSAGVGNDWLREQSSSFEPWDLGGALRARLEYKEYLFTPGQPGQVDFRKEVNEPENTYLLLRARVHVGYNSEWVSVFAEGQESSSTGDNRNPNLESDLFDFRQGFILLGDPEKFPLVAKIGRQEMIY